MGKKVKQQPSIAILIAPDDLVKLEQMLNTHTKSKDAEFEVSFRNINYPNYMRIVEHYVNLVPEDNISSVESLDITVQLPGNNTYRTALLEHDAIIGFMKRFERSKPGDIHNYLLTLESRKDKIEIMFKDRGKAERLQINELNMSAKVSDETLLLTKGKRPKLTGGEKILYRYKQRVSFDLESGARIDITEVKESNNIWALSKSPPKYELEVEAISRKITFDQLITELDAVLCVVQDTDTPITKTEAQNVVQNYKDLLKLKYVMHLESRNTVSIESQHIVNFVPNRYAVTDKADGDRYFLFILETGCYLISVNMSIKKTQLKTPEKKYHNTILDGELIRIDTGDMYLVFDVIYSHGTDYRYQDKYLLPKRIEIMIDIVDKCFGTVVPFIDYTDKNTNLELDSIKTYYQKELRKYWKEFRKALGDAHKERTKTITHPLYITRKLYFVPYGFDSSEVFAYADLIWKTYVYEKLTPYSLDGIIYTPINSPYMIRATSDNLDSVPLEYKWKRPQQNSIDFYIRFETDSSGTETTFFDNAVTQDVGKSYKVCTLYVGIISGSNEKPIPFKVGGVEQKANIYLTDGEARDVEGRVIENNTVVEFVYDTTKTDLADAYKWIPIRTRYDKTESVIKYGKRYGNNLNIALRIWRSIMNPITEDNIASLGDPSSYQHEMDRLAKNQRTPHVHTKPSFTYYQNTTTAGTGMRAFNNWIKTNMISTYGAGKRTVLDIGCGRGGDLLKFIRMGGIEEYVGTDLDNNGLYFIPNCAYDRYMKFKKTMPNVPPMYFINVDSRGLFNVSAQTNILPMMSDDNKALITTHLSGKKKYDIINCQFTIHYYLSDEISWSNFCKNISDHINDNGYLLVTCFDGQLIYDKMKGKQKLVVSHTDNTGNKTSFFEINKVYDDADVKDIGTAIDLYNSLISKPDSPPIREYLVFPKFLQESLKQNCGLDLVETDTFYNLFHLYKKFFTQGNQSMMSDPSKTESKTRKTEAGFRDRRDRDNKPRNEFTAGKTYAEIHDFYSILNPANSNQYSVEEIDTAIASFKLAILNRYFVFQKKANIDISTPSRLVGFNRTLQMGKILTPYFQSNQLIVDPDYQTPQINKLYEQIKKRYVGTRPTVYLIKHTISENSFNNEPLRSNRVSFYKIKDGTDPKILLIYKSPEKQFSPLYYLDADEEPNHMLDSRKSIDDLNILVELTSKLNQTLAKIRQ